METEGHIERPCPPELWRLLTPEPMGTVSPLAGVLQDPGSSELPKLSGDQHRHVTLNR